MLVKTKANDMRPISLTLFLYFVLITLNAQQEFSLQLRPFTIEGFTGIQSFASGQYENYILLIGGRTDGLHQRQPFASFDPAGNNTSIQVIDPASRERWAVSASSLSPALAEQLQSTNMQFYQEGGFLYLTGGYGYSPSAGDHITHNRLTAIAVAPLIEAIIEGQDISPYFRQITDDFFAVTGGYLEKAQETYYLIGGQRFTGRYNPHNGPSFVQEYTNQIRKFRIIDDGETLSVADKEAITDEVNLHRRDYNVLPQIFPDGTYGMTAFSGVFQHTEDLPFLNSVDIRPSGYTVNNDFLQYLNHYHCGTLPLYDANSNRMHSVFFGGISQYFLDENGALIRDDNVPFVSTIGRVSRMAGGNMTEQKIGELPSLLGSGSEFMLLPGVPQYAPGIIDLAALPEDTTLIGYLIGGIASTQPNIFFINNGTQSWAQTTLFEVHYIPESTTSYHFLESHSIISNLEAYPNPAKQEVNLDFRLAESTGLAATVQDTNGRIISVHRFPEMAAGFQTLKLSLAGISPGAYILVITDGREQKHVTVMVE